MMRPTPGPWYIGEDRAEDCPDHANSGLALIDTGRTEDWPIARLVEWNNVHLLVSAPDGLALAYAVAEHFQDTDAPLGKMAREFIRKATGE